MRLVRLFIVALLAVLLPLRGTLAAVAVCEDMDAGTRTEQALHSHAGHGDTTVAMEVDAAVDHGHGDDGTPGHDHNALTHVAKCATSCSVTPLAASEPRLAGSVAVATISFPAYTALVPSFISDGQERPPRTI